MPIISVSVLTGTRVWQHAILKPLSDYYPPPGRDLYCSPCRLYEPTYRSSPHIHLEEVMWKAEEEVYSDNLLRRRRLSE